MKQYRTLFGNRNFMLLWIGTAISNIGDFFNSIALVKVLSADPAHLGLWMSLIMIVKVLPGVVLGPVAGVVADRIPRRTIMVIADVLRAGLVAGLVFAEQPSVIILLVALAATVSTFSGPAYSALLPSIVKPEELVAANSLSVITGRMAMLIGNGLGAVVMLFVGAHNVFLIDSASYLISAAFRLALVLPAAAAVAKAVTQNQGLMSRFTTDLKEAFSFIRQTPTIRHLMTTIALGAIPDAAISVLMTTFFTVELGLAAEGLGLVWALMGGAAVVGALGIGAVGNRIHWKYLLSAGLAYIWAFALAALLAKGVITSSIFVGLIGLGSGVVNVAFQAAIGLVVPNEVRGRVFGAWNTLNNLIFVAGTLLAGWLSDRIGPSVTMMGFVTFYLIAGVQIYVAFRHEGKTPQAPAAAATGD